MSQSDLPGDARIGPYRLLGKLGAGGMGTVYKAVQDSLQRTVALKVVNPTQAADPVFQERFLREARAMARIQSPFVVACHDAGLANGQLYMSLELVAGGDLLGLLERKGGRLPEELGLHLLRDALEGLEAIEEARLIHRDLKPANIFLTERGNAKLADLGLARSVQPGADRATMAGMILGTPAYISPEQARGETDIDIRSDLCSLGATLFHLLTGETPYPAGDPLGVLVRVLNDPVPDARERRPDISEPTARFISRLLDKERTRRPPSARAARGVIEELLRSGRSPRPPATPSASAATPPPPPAPTLVSTPSPPPAPREERTPLATPSLPGERPTSRTALTVDPAQLQQLAKRIVVDQNGLRASLALAPGASFPRTLLDQLLAVSAIRHGLIEDNLVASGRTADLPRRITLAKGDAPTPDAAGRNVFGAVIPPIDLSVTIRVSEDQMTAAALYRPAKPPTPAEVRAALAAAGIVHGLDEPALARFAGKPPSGGKLVVAKGIAMRPPVDAGFALCVGPAGELGLTPVEPGDTVAVWREAEAGADGCDVLGNPIPAGDYREPEPEILIGVGTELGRTRDGDLCLRATRQGVVHRQPDGRIRVVGVLEIPGDLSADTPITTDDVVVVRGNVLAGASIASTADIVVVGDLADAHVSAGGDLEVRGAIGEGREIRAAGTVVAADMAERRVLAGNVRVSGCLTNCSITATGAIQADKVVGGSLAAGGDIAVASVGDNHGTPTVLWAGHHQSLDRQSDLIRLEEARIEAKRAKLLNHGAALQAEQEDLQKRAERIEQSHVMNNDHVRLARERQAQIARQQDDLRREVDTDRHDLVRNRQQRVDLEQRSSSARVQVGGVAYDGVTVRVGNRDPQLLAEPRVRPVF